MNSDDLGTCNRKLDEMRQKWAIHFNKGIYPYGRQNYMYMYLPILGQFWLDTPKTVVYGELQKI